MKINTPLLALFFIFVLKHTYTSQEVANHENDLLFVSTFLAINLVINFDSSTVIFLLFKQNSKHIPDSIASTNIPTMSSHFASFS